MIDHRQVLLLTSLVLMASGAFALNFGPERPLNVDAAFDSSATQDTAPAIAAGTNGRWLVAWLRSTPVNTQIRISRSDNFAATWGTPQILDQGSNLTAPHLITDRQGHWYSIWQNNGVLRFARSLDNGFSWTPPTDLTTATTFGNASLSPGNDQMLIVAYIQELSVYFSRSPNRGASWESSKLLYTGYVNPGGDHQPPSSRRIASPQVIYLGENHWQIAWSYSVRFEPSAFGGGIMMTETTNNGETWSTPIEIIRESLDQIDYKVEHTTLSDVVLIRGKVLNSPSLEVWQAKAYVSQNEGTTWPDDGTAMFSRIDNPMDIALAASPLNPGLFIAVATQKQSRSSSDGGNQWTDDTGTVAGETPTADCDGYITIMVWSGKSQLRPETYGLDSDLYFTRATIRTGIGEDSWLLWR